MYRAGLAAVMAVTLTSSLAGQTARPGTAASRPPAGARQTIIQWYLAPTVQASEAFLLKTTQAQVQAFRTAATPEQAMFVALLDLAIAPGPTYARLGQPASVKGHTVEVKVPRDAELAFQEESVSGDRAIVPVAIRSGEGAARTGTFELTREDGAWRIASIDLAEEPRLPRLDSPKFIGEFAAVVIKVLEQERARLREATVQGKLRMLASAQFTFSAIHGGVHAPLECLAKPRLCAPADPLRRTADGCHGGGRVHRHVPRRPGGNGGGTPRVERRPARPQKLGLPVHAGDGRP